MKKLLTATFALLACLTLQAQICGTSMQDQHDLIERLKKNRERVAQEGSAGTRDVDYYVPVKFHLVGKADGSQVVNESLILNMLCNLNNDYADQDIQFYLKMPFNYIYNDALYSNAGSSGGVFQIQQNKVNNAMNIYIVGSFPQGNLNGYYQGPWPQNDFIVIKKSAVYGNTAPHEVGHFFSLAHPFYGWEGHPWNEAEHGAQVEQYAPSDPNELGNVGLILNEKQDQSNCTAAADHICDTSPDYLFAFSQGQSGCNTWNGGTMDPNGDVVDPIETNMMSYFGSCSNYDFTAGQKDAIIMDLESSARTYVRPNYTPSTESITDEATLVSPIDAAVTPGYNIVEFDWDPVAGAEYYFLEIDFLPTFGGNPKRYVVQGTFKSVDDADFNPSSLYYWRVKPFGEYFTCNTPFSNTETFTTGNSVNTNELEIVSGWNIRPNPVSTTQMLNIEIDATQSFDADINVFSTSGQLLKSVGTQNLITGVNTIPVSMANLSAGIYIISIQTTEGLLNKRVVITN